MQITRGKLLYFFCGFFFFFFFFVPTATLGQSFHHLLLQALEDHVTVAATLSFVFQERSAKIRAARLRKNIFMMYISAVAVGESIPPPSDCASIKEATSGRFYDEAPF